MNATFHHFPISTSRHHAYFRAASRHCCRQRSTAHPEIIIGKRIFPKAGPEYIQGSSFFVPAYRKIVELGGSDIVFRASEGNKGNSAIHTAAVYAGQMRDFAGQHFWGER